MITKYLTIKVTVNDKEELKNVIDILKDDLVDFSEGYNEGLEFGKDKEKNIKIRIVKNKLRGFKNGR